MQKRVETMPGLLDMLLEHIRKLDSGSVDLDVAREKHSALRTVVRVADLSLQQARVFKGRSFPDGVPILWHGDEPEGAD